MSKVNSKRSNCKDVFNAFLVEKAKYQGSYEFPAILPTYDVPTRLVSFSKAISSKDTDQWVHFFEDDCMFERLWRNPKRYLDVLRRFHGVILPDYSLYRDMPLVMQLWNIYRSRAIGHWLQQNGVAVIPCVRYGDYRTYRCCCDGLPKHSVIAIGTHGTFKNLDDRTILLEGLDVVVDILQPVAIVVYGSAPAKYFDKYSEMGIQIIQMSSDYASSHKEVI